MSLNKYSSSTSCFHRFERSRLEQFNSTWPTITESGGRVLYSEPLQLWDSFTGAEADFATRFSITTDTSNRGFTGNGLVFFLAHLNYLIPLNSAGGGYGLLNDNTSLFPSLNRIIMVEFDTFPNTKSIHPTG
ncbi:Legume lectin domain containing protein [Trema orientale]|uniref:Legume lectin domain containing protein n=1 Tax=Trema orientale TaxID=63057 RepID=A0A2P5EHU5_TREOI|nr:Legume lectin domain containing protein [Trema orientale]